MKLKLRYKVIIGIGILVLIASIILVLFAKPWLETKLQAAIKGIDKNHQISYESATISFLTRSVKLENAIILSNETNNGSPTLSANIATVELKGISVIKALFNKELHANRLNISGCSVYYVITKTDTVQKPTIIPAGISLGAIDANNINMHIRHAASSQSYELKDADLLLSGIRISNNDTLSAHIFTSIDFNVNAVTVVVPDSLYTLNSDTIKYTTSSGKLTVANLDIHPNLGKYEFTSHHDFQTDRIAGEVGHISLLGFSAVRYLESGEISGSYFEIGKLNLDIFRDKRKAFKHTIKPTLHSLLRDFPSRMSIDSFAIQDGDINYEEHAKRADKAGMVSFNNVRALIYNITNDTAEIRKTKYLVIRSEALLMGKAKLKVQLKVDLPDKANSILCNGSLSQMEIRELNNILERNGFISIKSGVVDELSFNFTANENRASGKSTFLYHNLEIAVLNKETKNDDALKEQLLSLIVNQQIMNSNPTQSGGIRKGTIAYARDPEYFVFNYLLKSILSGVKSSLEQPSKRKKKS